MAWSHRTQGGLNIRRFAPGIDFRCRFAFAMAVLPLRR